MPSRIRGRCTWPGCPELQDDGTRCRKHATEADRRRGTSAERGYQSKRWASARKTVLRRDPVCVVRGPNCTLISTVADHHPLSRKVLIARGVPDPDDPRLLRGVCHNCHSMETARNQPGGFNQR